MHHFQSEWKCVIFFKDPWPLGPPWHRAPAEASHTAPGCPDCWQCWEEPRFKPGRSQGEGRWGGLLLDPWAVPAPLLFLAAGTALGRGPCAVCGTGRWYCVLSFLCHQHCPPPAPQPCRPLWGSLHLWILHPITFPCHPDDLEADCCWLGDA